MWGLSCSPLYGHLRWTPDTWPLHLPISCSGPYTAFWIGGFYFRTYGTHGLCTASKFAHPHFHPKSSSWVTKLPYTTTFTSYPQWHLLSVHAYLEDVGTPALHSGAAEADGADGACSASMEEWSTWGSWGRWGRWDMQFIHGGMCSGAAGADGACSACIHGGMEHVTPRSPSTDKTTIPSSIKCFTPKK